MFALLGVPALGPVAWLGIGLIAAVYLGFSILGWHYTQHHRKPRWERRTQRESAEPVDFEAARRVRDRTRRGPTADRRAS